jgi:EAL domain-containing protein (putative c-di-GMP-specific phosphodiesterase class I)
MQGWCLERVATGGLDAMVPIERFPFIVGRDPACDFAIGSSETSRQHARIDQDVGGLLRITDLNSGNGTFINHVPIHGSALVANGDVVHFGGTEFRVRSIDPSTFAALTTPSDGQTVIFSGRSPSLSDHFVLQERQFTEMLAGNTVRAAYQPIVTAPDGQLFAFEVLGRGCVSDLPASPMGLFELAARLDKEVALSEAFRWAGMSDATMFAPDVTLFVNAHPKEVFTEAFYQSIARLRAMRPAVNLVVEVHETAVARIADVRTMADRLSAMQVRFAYDDFGAGQARLLELAEVPPHFVKFDMGLIRGIDSASAIKQQLVSQLVRIVHDVGATALAEGVETAAEARVCVEIGFDLIQGYFTGQPALPEDGWADTPDYVSHALREVTAFLRK